MRSLRNRWVLVGLVVLLAAGCSKDEGSEPGERVKVGMAEGYGQRDTSPMVVQAQHPTGRVKREIRVPEEVKERWKTVKIKIRDRKEASERTLTLEVGKETPVAGTRLSIRVEAFLPHYMIYGSVISSKSNDPVNPAAMVELLEEGKSLARGWIFEKFAGFNSYNHERYELILLPSQGDGP